MEIIKADITKQEEEKELIEKMKAEGWQVLRFEELKQLIETEEKPFVFKLIADWGGYIGYVKQSKNPSIYYLKVGQWKKIAVLDYENHKLKELEGMYTPNDHYKIASTWDKGDLRFFKISL